MPVKMSSMRELLTGNNIHTRKISDYWFNRLIKNGLFTETKIIEFHNGYKKDSPRIRFQVKSYYHHEAHYFITLGKCIYKNEAADKLSKSILDEMLAASIKIMS